MLFIKKFLSLFILAVLFSCYTLPPPDWILNQPIDDEYWYGYGIVTKSFKGNLREEARKRAIEEIASQISIEIASNFKTRIVEKDYSIEEYTESISEARINANLENIEVVGTYKDKEEVTLFARLNKESYYETIRRKRANSVEIALGYLEQADKVFSSATFSLLEKAGKQIENYLDSPITIQYPKVGGKIQNLYPLIQLKISDYYNRIDIKTRPNNIDGIIGFPIKQKIIVDVQDRDTGNPISGISMYSIVYGDTVGISKSNEIGRAEFVLSRINNKKALQSFDIIVNHNETFEDSKFNNKIFASIPINARPPRISMKSNEKNLKKDLKTSPVSQNLKQIFQEIYGAEFVDSNGDLHINLDVSTEKKTKNKNEYGLFIAYGNLSIDILNQNGKEIFSMAITGEMGRSFSNHRLAGLEAIDELNKKVMKKLKFDLDSVFRD